MEDNSRNLLVQRCAWVALVLFVSGFPVLAQETPANPWGPEEIIRHHAPALITVRFVVEVDASGALGGLLGGKEEFPSEATCLVLDPRGVAVCSNTVLEGMSQLMVRFLGPAGRGMELSARPTQLTAEVEGQLLDAEILATDSELDLAWLQIDVPPTMELDIVSLESIDHLGLGDPIFLLQTLEEHFDHARVCIAGSIGGETSLPRRLLVPTVQLETAFGIPVFSTRGNLAGITVLQMSETESTPDSGGTLSLMRQTTRLRSLARTMILPAETLANATARVLAASPPVSPEP